VEVIGAGVESGLAPTSAGEEEQDGWTAGPTAVDMGVLPADHFETDSRAEEWRRLRAWCGLGIIFALVGWAVMK
jgi:hypothetical protein